MISEKKKDGISSNEADLTGRDRMVSNILTSWGVHLFILIAGFIMPRMIDRHVGQISLGIWDFCWSFVNYLSLTGLGVGSSVNRYVARFRVIGDTESLSKAVSSVVFIQLIICAIVILGTVLISLLIPMYFSGRLGNEVEVARWVVTLLGMSLAIQMAFDTSRGIMTGCHRWDMHNGINAASSAVNAIVMFIALIMGGGLKSLGFIYLCVVAVTEVVRTVIAHRICPEIQVSIRNISKTQAKQMLLFGMNTVIASSPQLILVQTTNIFVGSMLGPASLAVFSRPTALVRHIETLINKFAHILTPTAGSIEGTGNDDELRKFFLNSTKYGVAFTLPIVILMVVFGDTILGLWMGPEYANGTVLAILAIGYFLPVAQGSTMRILMGLDLHGRVGRLNLIICVIVFVCCSLLLNTSDWTLPKLAMLIAIPLTLSNGIFVPVYACKKLGITIKEYLKHVFLVPSICGSVFAGCLIACRISFHDNSTMAFVFGGIVGAIVLGSLYWQYIISTRIRTQISQMVNR